MSRQSGVQEVVYGIWIGPCIRYCIHAYKIRHHITALLISFFIRMLCSISNDIMSARLSFTVNGSGVRAF
jgi:hypothetical protein